LFLVIIIVYIETLLLSFLRIWISCFSTWFSTCWKISRTCIKKK